MAVAYIKRCNAIPSTLLQLNNLASEKRNKEGIGSALDLAIMYVDWEGAQVNEMVRERKGRGKRGRGYELLSPVPVRAFAGKRGLEWPE